MKKNKVDIQKWNEMMFTKHPNMRVYMHKNPIVRFIELNRIKSVVKYTHPKKDDIIIEIGCGEGYLLKKLSKSKEVVGLDIARNALEKAKKDIAPNQVKLVCSDAAKIPFPSDYFDKVICSEVLEHVKNPKLVIDEVYRICKENGLLVISVPYEAVLTTIKHFFGKIGLFKLFFGNLEPSTSEWNLQSFTPASLKELLEPNFNILKTKLMPFPLIGPKIVIKCTKK